MRNRRKRKFFRKRIGMFLTLSLVLLTFTIGYSTLSTTMSINGTSKMANATWDVKFNNIQPVSGSVTPTTAPSITNDTSVSFAARLENPGDFYEFTIDVVNNGTIDAMLDSYSLAPNLTAAQQNYFNYTVSYSDGTPLADNKLLAAGTTEKLKVSFKYLETNNIELYPEDDQTFNFSFSMDYAQKDSTAIAVSHPSMENDSWEKIISNVQNNTIPSYYTVGSTKTVDMGTLGTHTLRVANNSTPAECSTAGFSQTACGFVLEFADIITTHAMNSDNSGSTNGTGNKGGWKYSEMRTYVNNDIYNALPTSLKNAIINTTVVSGHGSKDTTNFTTTDKLYLLSTKEVWGKEGTSNVITDDTAEAETRQLDYYKSQNVTTSSYSGAIKQRNGSNSDWWLRSARSGINRTFYKVGSSGSYSYNYSNSTSGVAPAFRIA